jgi:hypothetical protein
MNNVTEIFRKLKLSNAKAPGNFIKKKEIKALIKDNELKFEKTDDNEYMFDDKLTEAYSEFIDVPKKEEVKEIQETSSFKEYKELCKIIGENSADDYVNKLFSWFILHDNFYTLSSKFDDNPLKYSIDNFDVCISAYLHMIKSHCILNHRKVNRGEIRNLCRDIKKSFSQVWVSQYNNPNLFRKDNVLYRLSRTNKVQEIKL